MRTRLIAFVLCVCLALPLLLLGCDSAGQPSSPTPASHVVTFYVDGEVYEQRTVPNGSTVSPPVEPQKNNLLFDAWTSAQGGGYEYDFSVAVTSPINLYASFIPDAVSITNQITTGAIRAVVTVNNVSYNEQKFLGITIGRKDVSQTNGSGVIIRIDGNTAYLLTNCHVAATEDGRSHSELSVTDYRGNTYAASIWQAPSAPKAISPAYDLALLVFRFDAENPLVSLELSPADPVIGDHLVALGQPKGQTNAIAYGRAADYRKITLNNTSASQSDVRFEVLQHTAYTDGGSSGGPLLNTDLQVAGINYAGSHSEQSFAGYSIPISRVREFLNSCGFR